MKKIFIAALVLLSSIVFSADPIEINKEKAIHSAHSWLTLLDSGKIQESWDDAGKLFKSQITSEQWVKALNEARESLGKFKIRKIKNDKFLTSIPGCPEGRYFILTYSADFAKSKNVTELVTLACEQDSMYKVIGYFIK